MSYAPEDDRGLTGVLFVCLGNICRSPLAEGLFQQLVEQRGLQSRYTVASAGTGNWHVGDPADSRMIVTAQRHGIELQGRAHQVSRQDFDLFDLILAMDRTNQAQLLRMARDDTERAGIHLLREFDPQAGSDLDVPDPYFGGPDGFEHVYQIVERACVRLLSELEGE